MKHLPNIITALRIVGSILDSIADLLFVACCAIQLLPILSIPSWLWIWAGIIVIIKIVNQIIALTRIKQLCLPHTIANKLTGFLLFLTVPTISWCIIPIAIVAIIAQLKPVELSVRADYKLSNILLNFTPINRDLFLGE